MRLPTLTDGNVVGVRSDLERRSPGIPTMEYRGLRPYLRSEKRATIRA